MAEFSNMLRQRLAATQDGARVHPDADTLTAFSEQLLPGAERQQVMAHLAACAPCRELLALSQSETPAAVLQPVFKPAPVSSWRRFFTPAMGLGAAVAGIALTAVLVLHSPQKPALQQPEPSQDAKAPVLDQKPVTEAKASPAPDQSAASESQPAVSAKPAPPAVSAGLAGMPRGKDRVENRTLAASVAPARVSGNISPANNALPGSQAAAAPPVLAAELKKSDFVNTSLFANDGVVADWDGRSASPPATQAQASATRFVANANTQFPGFSDIPPAPAGDKSHIRMLPSAPPDSTEHYSLVRKIERSARSAFGKATAPAINSNTLSFSAMGGTGTFSADLQKGQPIEAASAPAKSEASALEQSDALSARSMSARRRLGSGVVPSGWKVVDGTLMKDIGQSWEDAYPASVGKFEFTFVQSHGGDVWAGGTQAMLIHSRDAGATWESVKLGDTASGSIVNVLFGGNRVQVKTSDDQAWSSSDGGKTWSLQPAEK